MESTAEGWYVAGAALPRGDRKPEMARSPEAPAGR
jgi:hypothetical protein